MKCLNQTTKTLFYLLNTIPTLSLVHQFFSQHQYPLIPACWKTLNTVIDITVDSPVTSHSTNKEFTGLKHLFLTDAKLLEKHIHREVSPLPLCHLCRAVSHSHPSLATATQSLPEFIDHLLHCKKRFDLKITLTLTSSVKRWEFNFL